MDQPEMFSASGAQPSSAPGPVVHEDAEQRLMTTIAELDELVARAAEVEPAELDPDVVALLNHVTAHPKASMEARSLRRRVDAGTLTWRAFWSAPQDHAGGVALWSQVQQGRMQVSIARANERSGRARATTSTATTSTATTSTATTKSQTEGS